MFRFLRFEIGGASALLWTLLFLSPYLVIDRLVAINAVSLFSLILSSITLSVPLGNYVHQFTDTVFNPFRAHRLFFGSRAVISEIRDQLGAGASHFRDNTFQAVLVFSKVYETSAKTGVDGTLKIELLKEEISNRYSYYYARIENGLVAPAFGAAFAALLFYLFRSTGYVSPASNFSLCWIAFSAVLLGSIILSRIPHLFRELDDLEVALVRLQKPFWPQL
jgi:hypothetical protein